MRISSNNQIKVAVIFFGLPRCSEKTTANIQKYILDPLSEYDLTVYSCLNLQREICNSRNSEAGNLGVENYVFFDQFNSLNIDPNQYFDKDLYSKLLSYGDAWENNGESLRFLLWQLMTLRLGYLNASKIDYDFYVFVRPDLVIHSNIPLKSFITKQIGKKSVLIPSWQWFDGLNDRFAITTSKAASSYALRYDSMIDFCESLKKPLHSEELLEYVLNACSIKTFSTGLSRVRVNGEVVKESFCSSTNHGIQKQLYSHLNNIHFIRGIFTCIQFLIYVYILRKIKKIILSPFNNKN